MVITGYTKKSILVSTHTVYPFDFIQLFHPAIERAAQINTGSIPRTLDNVIRDLAAGAP